MKRRSFSSFVWYGLMLAGVVCFFPAKPAWPQEVIAPSLETALLAGDWEAVRRQCGDNDKLSGHPVLLALKGQACLLLNRNNEAAVLFLRLGERVDSLQAWKSAALTLAQRHPQQPVAHYLKGDALARLEEWPGAEGAFTEAIRLKETFAPAWNARGVVKCAQGKWEQAGEDFSRAKELEAHFADAWASLGTYYLLQQQENYALEHYQAALAVNGDFALALTGTGAAHFMRGPREFKDAHAALQKSFQLQIFPVTVANVELMTQFIVEAMSKGTLSFSTRDFINWPALKQEIARPGSMFCGYFDLNALSEKPDRKVLDGFNRLLEDKNFYSSHQPAIEARLQASREEAYAREVKKLIEKTKDLRENNGRS